MRKKVIIHEDHVIVIHNSDDKVEGVSCVENKTKLVCSVKEHREV